MRVLKIKMYDGDIDPLVAGVRGVIEGIKVRKKYSEELKKITDKELEKKDDDKEE